jgi:central kinetochore subunit Mal2/MCM21
MSDILDDEIAQVRAEIQALTQQRKLLTSSLLSSTKVQSRLSDNPPPTTTHPPNDGTPLNIANVQEHNQSNVHRLAFGVTGFPFVDPSPELQTKNPLLGIRIDVCNRHGKFDSSYYIFCVRANDRGQELRIHRHTIPALVPLEQYERVYLPWSSPPREEDEGYVGSDGAENAEGEGRKQDLHTLVSRVRYDLVSWRLRKDAAEWLKEELGLSRQNRNGEGANSQNSANSDGGEGSKRRDSASSNSGHGHDEHSSDPDTEMTNSDDSDEDEPTGRFNVDSLTTLEVDARQLRIIWSDDRVGRLKISDDGKIEKAVVIGDDGNRARDVERMLMGDGKDGCSVKQLLERLEMVYKKSNERKVRETATSPNMPRAVDGRRKRKP